MSVYPAALDALIDGFAALPGIGFKSAQRLAFHLLSLPEAEAEAFASAILHARKSIHFCPVCQNLTDRALCPVCDDDTRDRATVCVVSDARTVMAMEKVREYKGMYIKCNNYELMKYCGAKGDPECMEDVLRGGMEMKNEVGHSIFITCNKDGIKIFEDEISHVPTYPVEGEIDVTGAGDASNAGIVLSLALGLTPTEAAAVACCVSSITIQQLGTTGTATVEGVIERLYTIDEMMK